MESAMSYVVVAKGSNEIRKFAAATMLDEKLAWHLNELKAMTVEDRIARRLAKFREIARFYTNA